MSHSSKLARSSVIWSSVKADAAITDEFLRKFWTDVAAAALGSDSEGAPASDEAADGAADASVVVVVSCVDDSTVEVDTDDGNLPFAWGKVRVAWDSGEVGFNLSLFSTSESLKLQLWSVVGELDMMKFLEMEMKTFK